MTEGHTPTTPGEPAAPAPWWRDRRRLALVAGVAVLVVAALGVTAWALLGSRRETTPRPSTATVPNETTTTPTSTVPTGSALPTGSASPTSSTTPSSGAVPASKPRVAYRMGGVVWVADEDGSNARSVYAAAEGPYAISPDGATLAVIGPTDMLVLIDIASGVTRQVEPAQRVEPSWAPSSAWVAYTSGGHAAGQLRAVTRDGISPVTIAAGRAPKVARDGRTIAFLAGGSTGQDGALMLSVQTGPTLAERGQPAAVAGAEHCLDMAWGSALLYFSTDMGETAGSEIKAASRDGTPPRTLVAPRAGDPPTVYTGLYVSAPSERLLFAAGGDDGFSRTMMLDTGTGAVTPAGSRYDTYPVGWSSDGSRVFYVEGNAFQGEPTKLVSAGPDDSDRRALIAGAGK